jgi:hypothetical protein
MPLGVNIDPSGVTWYTNIQIIYTIKVTFVSVPIIDTIQVKSAESFDTI